LLDSVYLPASLDTIAPLAFADSPLTYINCKAPVPPFFKYRYLYSPDGQVLIDSIIRTAYLYFHIDVSNCKLVVPCASVELYRAAPVWQEFDIVSDRDTTIFDSICNGKTYNFYGRILNTIGTYTHTIAGGIDECDTIITLHLNVIECPEMEISLFKIPEICSDNESFVIEYQSINAENISVVFNEKARLAGFMDIAEQSTINQYITVPLPKDIRPDNYSAKIIFEGRGKTKEFPLNFTVLYSSKIIQQKWNNVLALLNQYYNGGYVFSTYEWYKNGAQIPNENGSYLYVGAENDLDFSAEYRARITRADDDVTLFTCPFFPAPHEEIFGYPVIIVSASNIIVKISAKTARASLWSVTGIPMGEYLLQKGDNQITAPQQQGVYILKISTENGVSTIEKIVVK